jgi:hypothetical protein
LSAIARSPGSCIPPPESRSACWPVTSPASRQKQGADPAGVEGNPRGDGVALPARRRGRRPVRGRMPERGAAKAHRPRDDARPGLAWLATARTSRSGVTAVAPVLACSQGAPNPVGFDPRSRRRACGLLRIAIARVGGCEAASGARSSARVESPRFNGSV